MSLIAGDDRIKRASPMTVSEIWVRVSIKSELTFMRGAGSIPACRPGGADNNVLTRSN